MTKNILVTLILLQTIIAPIARASEVRAFIYRNSIWSGGAIVVDGKQSRGGFTGLANLSDAMKSNPEAAAFADKAHTDAVWGNSLLLGGLVGAIGYAVASTNFDSDVYWTIFLVGFVPGVLFQDAAAVNLNKAINTYNGVEVTFARFKPDRLMVLPTADGAVAGLNWRF
jgi:hypothetical protein